MSAARKAALWMQVSSVLAEYERAQTEALRLEVAKTWDSLRQKLQALALEDEMLEADQGVASVEEEVSAILEGARCLVVEDEPVVLHALGRLLRRSRMTVFTAEDVATGLRLLREERPDVVVTDLQFQTGSGEAIVHAARTQVPSPGVVVFSGVLDVLLPITLRQQGALVLDKSRAAESLVGAVAAALAGRRDPGSATAKRLLSAVPSCTVLEEAVQRFAEHFRLSPRQAEALRMITTQLDSEAIAVELGVGESTLRVHLDRIAEKVGISYGPRTREALLRALVTFCAGQRGFP